LNGSAKADQSLRHHGLRFGCADRQRLGALGSLQHSGIDYVDSKKRRRRERLMPEGAIQSRTDFGTDGYDGPCPPKGDRPHHYYFTLFAVDADKLPDAQDHNASAALVGFDLHFHTLGKVSLTATYGR
jgi:Raf kinase inhibitor-like YbhB/YbcL family protein